MSAKSGSKTQRYNIAQRDHLIQYMESHSMFAAGKFSGKEGKNCLRHRWDALAQELNSIRGGAQKDSIQWHTVWRDLKHKVSKRVSEIRTEQQRSTGNTERKHPPLTIHELRVAGVIGPEYVQGSFTCPDSIPETEMQLERLEKGDESVLDENPLVLTVPLVDPQSNEEMEQTVYVLDDKAFTSNEANEMLTVGADGEGCPSIEITPSSEAFTPSLKKKMVKRTRKASRVRIGTQLQEARTDFQELCASNTRAMEMLAQATMKQAEAASVQAQAALLHAENESERIKMFSKLTDVLERALEKLK